MMQCVSIRIVSVPFLCSDLTSCFWQSALASLEQVLPQEVPLGREIGPVLLAGDHSGVPQYAHYFIGALQPTRLAHNGAG